MYYSCCLTLLFFLLVEPDDVTLETNITPNNDCFGLWVNLTCRTSAASPPPHNYVLLKNESEVSFSTTSKWIKKIQQRKTFVFCCVAYQLVVNITNTTVTGNGKIGIFFRCNVIIAMFEQLSVAYHSVSVALHVLRKK